MYHKNGSTPNDSENGIGANRRAEVYAASGGSWRRCTTVRASSMSTHGWLKMQIRTPSVPRSGSAGCVRSDSWPRHGRRSGYAGSKDLYTRLAIGPTDPTEVRSGSIQSSVWSISRSDSESSLTLARPIAALLLRTLLASRIRPRRLLEPTSHSSFRP
jgi:hypothetical protein